MEQIFEKNKAAAGKTSLFVIGPFLVTILFVLTLAFDRAVLNGTVFPILVVSTKKRYSSFLEKVFVFQKLCF